MRSPYPLNEAQAAAWRARLIEVLAALRQGDVPFIAGVRKVLAIANEPQERDKAFDLFIAIDSATDHLPPAHAEERCSAEWLAECKLQERAAEVYYRDAVNQQIENLLAMLNEGQSDVA